MAHEINTLYAEIIKKLEKSADTNHAQGDKRYHKYDGYHSYGIRAPDLDNLIKPYKKQFKALDQPTRLSLVRKIYQSRIEEQLLTANIVLATGIPEFAPTDLHLIDELSEYLMSWSTADDFCSRILQPILVKYPSEIIALLRRWNTSENIWQRRASIVAFTRKIGEGGKFTDEVLQLCDNLINDKEDLIQKAIGWVLKDNLRGSKQKVLEYIVKLRQHGVPATITLYAIKDLTGGERQRILNIKPKEL